MWEDLGWRRWKTGGNAAAWFFLLLGVNGIFLGALILVFPQLLAYLVAGFLICNSVMFLWIGWKLWRANRVYGEWESLWLA